MTEVTDMDLELFKNQWEIDDKCIEYLKSLPSNVVQKVIAEFAHRPDQTNPSARCRAFARKVAESNGISSFHSSSSIMAAATPGLTLAQQLGGDPLADFQLKWGLDERCMQFVGNLPVEIQLALVTDFDHQPHQTNPSARCMAFAKGLMVKGSQRGAMEEVLAFQQKWGVDDRCKEMLLSAPPQVRALVLERFDHRPEQTNVSARCTAFIQSIVKSQTQGMGGNMGGNMGGYMGGGGGCMGGGCMGNMGGCMGGNGMGMMGNMGGCMGNMGGFRPTQPNMRPNMQQQGGMMQPLQPRYPTITGQGPLGPRLQNFRQKWGLDDGCLGFLSGMPVQVQEAVMAEFEHQPHQTNASARCQAFAKKVYQRFAGGGDMMAPQTHMGGGGYSNGGMNMNMNMNMNMAQGGGCGCSGGCGGGGGGGMKRPFSEVDQPYMNLHQFQAKWGLDDKCIEQLSSFPVDIQTAVMSNFNHGPHQTNPSARCMAFAKSVAASQGQQVGSFNTDPLLPFQAKFGLDDRCIQLLSNMPAQVQAVVVAQFDHQAHQTNPSARCMAFAKSTLQRLQGQGGAW